MYNPRVGVQAAQHMSPAHHVACASTCDETRRARYRDAPQHRSTRNGTNARKDGNMSLFRRRITMPAQNRDMPPHKAEKISWCWSTAANRLSPMSTARIMQSMTVNRAMLLSVTGSDLVLRKLVDKYRLSRARAFERVNNVH